MKSGTLRKGPIVREVALAALAALVFTVSPFTPNELPPAAAGGFLVGAALLGWRLRPSSPVWREAAGSRDGAGFGRATALAGAVALLCLAVFAPTLQWMYGEWTRSIWSNEHGLFVPIAMVWLARNALRGDAGPAESSAWGFLPLAAGLALATIDVDAQTHYLSALGLLIALPGLSLLLLGKRRTRALRFALLAGIFLVPIPYTIGTPLALRTLTATGVLTLLQGLGYTAVRDGTLILLTRQQFLVADACSGVATLTASVVSALVLAVLAPSAWRRVALILSAPFLAIAANVVRVTLLVLLAQWFGTDLLDTALHEASGVATFGIVLVALIWLAKLRAPAGEAPA